MLASSWDLIGFEIYSPLLASGRHLRSPFIELAVMGSGRAPDSEKPDRQQVWGRSQQGNGQALIQPLHPPMMLLSTEKRILMLSKVKQRQELASLLQAHRQAGKRIVFTNGCFDLMHVGHTRYLQAAKDLGDLLVVAINSDESVKSLNKGPDRPIVPDAQRAEVVAALSSVDYIILFNEPDPQSLIATLQPDILVKGGDWAVEQIIGREIVEARGGVVHTIPLVPGVSTTTLIQRIRST